MALCKCTQAVNITLSFDTHNHAHDQLCQYDCCHTFLGDFLMTLVSWEMTQRMRELMINSNNHYDFTSSLLADLYIYTHNTQNTYAANFYGTLGRGESCYPFNHKTFESPCWMSIPRSPSCVLSCGLAFHSAIYSSPLPLSVPLYLCLSFQKRKNILYLLIKSNVILPASRSNSAKQYLLHIQRHIN